MAKANTNARKPLKVCLTNGGKDTETPWAEDLGPAPGPSARRGGRLVRLINVPFFHAKPTWGDTIVVIPTTTGTPTWDRNDVPFTKLRARIHADGGRWAMIVDYAPHPDVTAPAAFKALAAACAESNVACESAPTARGAERGRAFLAVGNALSDTDLMASLREAELPCELVQIHPAPKPTKAAKLGARKPTKKSAKRSRR